MTKKRFIFECLLEVWLLLYAITTRDIGYVVLTLLVGVVLIVRKIVEKKKLHKKNGGGD